MSDELTPPADPAATPAAPAPEEPARLPEPGISPIRIEDEMDKSFIDYSMSVIVGRALPDARDGLKPVHRRCIYSMGETGCTHSVPHRKSARVVGDVMGKYHPHGDSSIYETIVRLAQPFSMRYTLVDGHGNFGSLDGDKAAAMRYTEVRMERFAEDMLEDLDKETVDMVPNYDETLSEPTVLPSKLPNLLLNGSMGIAVGMATNIPTHNLNELCDAIVAMIDNPQITIPELMQFVQGPDFPTGGIICGTGPIRDMYLTGRATLTVRGRAEIEETEKRSRIVVTEIPYGVNKAEMLERVGELMRDKVLDGIADARDVSKADVRIEIDLKPDAVPQVVLNLLYKHTALQTTFGANMLALDHGRPKVMNLKHLLRCFIDHRVDVITRRTRYQLRKARERAHLLEGFRVAIDNIDEIVHIIRSSQTDDEAKSRMFERFGLDDVQASAILEMRLKQLTGLSRDKIEDEYNQVLANIARYEYILANPSEVLAIVKSDCAEMKQKYGDARRTAIEAADGEIDMAKIIANEKCVITLSNRGYVKRSTLAAFNVQKRGGKGRKGAKLKDADFIEKVCSAQTHDSLLFFTSLGRVFALERAWQLPEAEPNSFGKPVVNLLQLRPAAPAGTDEAGNPVPASPAEKVLEIVSIGNQSEASLTEADLAETGRFAVNEKRPLFSAGKAVLFVTRKGVVKKTVLSEFKNITRAGIRAINIDPDDELVAADIVEPGDELVIVSARGQTVHFVESELRPLGRVSRGVRGISLAADDEVRAVVPVEKLPNARILLLVENGFGTLNTFDAYPIHKRGGKGVKSIDTGDRNGKVVFAGAVHLDDPEADPPFLGDGILVITEKGQLIRTPASAIRQTARGAKGVRVVDVADGDAVVSATVVPSSQEEDDAPADDDTPTDPDAPASTPEPPAPTP
jgi:DNA gyrase subunit A